MTADFTRETHNSAIALTSAIWASLPCRTPAPTTRRRSSLENPSSRISAMASQSPAAMCARKRSPAWLAAFSSRGVGRLSSSNLASAASMSVSSNMSQRLSTSPSIAKTSIIRSSNSNPSCEVPHADCVMTAPRSFSRCTASIRPRIFCVISHAARVVSARSLAPLPTSCRWSTHSRALAGSSWLSNSANARVISDHVCAYSAASPAI